MGHRARDDANRYTEEYPDETFLDAVRDHEMPTTVEIAEAVGCSRSTAYDRLQALAEDGAVIRQKVGNANVWQSA